MGTALFLFGGPATVAAQSTSVTVHPKSQFWIQGEASSIDFTCRVNRVDGRATLPTARDTIPTSADREDQTEVAVTVPVKAFDCGKDRMTSDLQDALKMEEHPEIQFELVHATVKGRVDTSTSWRRVEVLGTLTIAGTKRLTRLSALGQAIDTDRFRVRGCHPIRMTYYNVDPPTKAFGLIRVDNRVEVQFDLFAHATSMTGDDPFASQSPGNPPACTDDS
jgi:hypothetical protein